MMINNDGKRSKKPEISAMPSSGSLGDYLSAAIITSTNPDACPK